MKKLFLVFVVFIGGMLTVAQSQDLNQAGESFNEGIAAQQGEDFPTAIAAYEKALSISNQLGDDGADLAMKSEKQLSYCYFSNGKNLYQEKKFNEAIQNFTKSVEYSKKAGDDKTEDAAKTYIAGIKTAYGNSSLKKEEYDKALGYYDEALNVKPDYIKAEYGKGLVYKKTEDLANMKISLDKVIAAGEEGDKDVENARNAAYLAFRNAGALSLQSGSNDEAVKNLNISLEYDNTDPRAYYYLAVAYNGASQWDNAVSAASKGLELNPDDKSDTYFELGKAYEGKGDSESACGAYKNVSTGANVNAAKYQMEQVLKCQ